MSTKRLKPADFHEHWHTHWESSVQDSRPNNSNPSLDAGVGAILLHQSANLQREPASSSSYPQSWSESSKPTQSWSELSKPTQSWSESSKPTVLKNPMLLLTSKGRPTESQAQSRAATGLPKRLQARKIKSGYEMKRRKCGLCGKDNAGHNHRNCPQKQLQNKLAISSSLQLITILLRLPLQLPGHHGPRFP